jgi:hypothetical protein
VRFFVALALVGCIYESGGGRDGGLGTGGSGGGTGGCNPDTGMGCACGGKTGCPAPTDVCTSFGVGGQFCSNACTQQDQPITCALAPGQPGQSLCLLMFNSMMPDHCVVLCAPGALCPAGMAPQVVQNTCVCVGP